MNDRTYRHKCLLIDDTHLLETESLQRKVNEAIKHPEPVLCMDAPWHRDTELLNYMNVMYDKDEAVFKMWYCVSHYAGEGHDGPSKLAYATSADGVNWDRPELGLVEIDGSTKNDYILPAMSVIASIIKDTSDVPERRYKMIFGIRSAQTAWAKFHNPLSLAYSADGIHWERPTHVNPVLRGISDDCFSLLYDVDRRKYLLFTRRVPNVPRDVSLYESYDLVNWEDKGRVLVPDELDPPEMHNFYYMEPFRYGDIFLSMLCTQYTSPISEAYDSYQRPPSYPNTRQGQVDIQLAYSHDGRDWRRPDDRAAVVTCGPPGSFEDVALYPAHSPIVRDGETWIYCLMQRFRHCWWSIQARWERDRCMRDAAVGILAKMPEDHWVSLDADAKEGRLLTKPIPFAPDEALECGDELLINADGSGGSIEAELVTPFGEVVEGFSRADSIPITSDGKGQPLRWKTSRAVGETIAKHIGGLCLKLHLKNAKVYSFATRKSDPDGSIARHWANARWCELIKHRSGNWDRLSTEPASGPPPHAGPGLKKG